LRPRIFAEAAMNRRQRAAWLAATGVVLGGVAGLTWWGALPLPGKLAGVLVMAGATSLLLSALQWVTPGSGCDSATPAVRRRYLREFLPPMLAYVLVLFASLWLLKRLPEPSALRGLVALAPVLPIALALRAIVRYIRDVDELQQRIELEAVSIATALVSLLYLAGGFLQLAGVIDVSAGMAMIWVFPLVCFAYGIAKAIVARRYA
jgi:hypothetical protein